MTEIREANGSMPWQASSAPCGRGVGFSAAQHNGVEGVWR